MCDVVYMGRNQRHKGNTGRKCMHLNRGNNSSYSDRYIISGKTAWSLFTLLSCQVNGVYMYVQSANHTQSSRPRAIIWDQRSRTLLSTLTSSSGMLVITVNLATHLVWPKSNLVSINYLITAIYSIFFCTSDLTYTQRGYTCIYNLLDIP